jgi:hypothetical protein
VPDPSAEAFIEAFHGGRLGASVRGLDLSGASPSDAHERLVSSGFHVVAVPWAAPTDREGGRRWRLLSGATTADPTEPSIACELVYEHRDGGVVRIFSEPFRCFGSGVVGPAARKSVIVPPDLRAPNDASLDAEIFAVTRAGEPVPKSCSAAHGMQAHHDGLVSWQHARSMLERIRIPLAPGRPVDASRLIDGLGLLPGRTIVLDAPFDIVLEDARRIASIGVRDAPIVAEEEPDALRLYCTGHQEVSSRAALACLSFVHATSTLGVEPSGYEASRSQLGSLLAVLFGKYGGRYFDNATGEELGPRIGTRIDRLHSPDVWCR